MSATLSAVTPTATTAAPATTDRSLAIGATLAVLLGVLAALLVTWLVVATQTLQMSI